SRSLEVLLRLADARHLRLRVDDVRDRVVAHVPVARDHALDAGDAFLLGLVREHRAADDVADREDSRDARLERIVDADLPARLQLDADLLEPEALGVRHTTDGDEDAIGAEHLAVIGLDLAALAVRELPHRGDALREADVEPLRAQKAERLRRDLGVHAREDAVEELEDADLASEPPPHRPELEPDRAGADDDESLGHGRPRERLRARAGKLAVDLDSADRSRLASRRDQDAIGL